MQYLVLGANGFIGSYAYKRMKAESLNVLGTGHLRKSEENLISFDILNDSICNVTDLITDKEKTAIICIAQANIDKCKNEYELSRQINVVSMKEVIRILSEKGFRIIWFSTDNVFDGIDGNYSEQSETNAVNEYGRMKEEMERFIVENYPDICIFRLPKVLGVERETQNLFTDLENKLESEEIKCIKGTRMSIVSKEDVYQACLIASVQKMKGLYNLSNGEIFSRKELTEKFFEHLGVDNKNIIELEVEKFGFKDARPLNISLDNSKFIKETGYKFMSLEILMKQYLDNRLE